MPLGEESKFLLLDEPTANLDPARALELLDTTRDRFWSLEELPGALDAKRWRGLWCAGFRDEREGSRRILREELSRDECAGGRVALLAA